MPRSDAVLFTAFEPSGDALAAGLIAELKRRRPEMKVFALGGPKMAAAGAELIEITTEHAVMLAGAIGKVMEHRARLKRLKRWLREHPIATHVPTDSPAANWSICKLVRKIHPGAKIVHLAAPQVWAWATWRIHKLRRLTDHVLCLLPFEEKWFRERNVPATFVGHPIFDNLASWVDPERLAHTYPCPLRLALLPGSRPQEWRKNWATMTLAAHVLRARHPDLGFLVAAVDYKSITAIDAVDGDRPKGQVLANLFIPSRTDEVIAWADAVLVVSGTATLQVAALRKPMVVLYNVSRWSWMLAGRWIVSTRTFALPNLISEAAGNGRAVPELVPHFGAVGPVVEQVDRLLSDPAAQEAQRAGLERVCAPFAGVSFKDRAADRLLEIVEGRMCDSVSAGA